MERAWRAQIALRHTQIPRVKNSKPPSGSANGIETPCWGQVFVTGITKNRSTIYAPNFNEATV